MSRWLLPIVFVASVGLSLCLFQSHPPRAQADLVALDTLVQQARSAYPNMAVKAIDAHAVATDYEVWTRYLAAPGQWHTNAPQKTDTVFVLTALSSRAAPSGVIWMREKAAFRAYLVAP